MVSPITGERIPASKIQEHMRYGLLDPNWKELKRRQIAEKQEEEEVFAAGWYCCLNMLCVSKSFQLNRFTDTQ